MVGSGMNGKVVSLNVGEPRLEVRFGDNRVHRGIEFRDNGRRTIARRGDAVPGIGLTAPHDCPSPVVAKLNAAAVQALNDPEVQKKLVALGLEVPPKDQLSPEALGNWQKAEIAKWWPMIKAANVKIN